MNRHYLLTCMGLLKQNPDAKLPYFMSKCFLFITSHSRILLKMENISDIILSL